MSDSERKVQVGDQFAFYSSFRGTPVIHVVTRVMPSGRFECGPYTCNPDMTVRGRNYTLGTPCATPVTDEIRADIKRSQLIGFMRCVQFSNLSDDALELIVDTVKGDGSDE